jgi:hypothetical protein
VTGVRTDSYFCYDVLSSVPRRATDDTLQTPNFIPVITDVGDGSGTACVNGESFGNRCQTPGSEDCRRFLMRC